MTLKIISRPVQQQLNAFDCGRYVVAQADDLANNIDPTNSSYKTQNTQHHLSRCLERGSLEPFPTTDKRTKCSKAVEAVLQLLNTFSFLTQLRIKDFLWYHTVFVRNNTTRNVKI